MEEVGLHTSPMDVTQLGHHYPYLPQAELDRLCPSTLLFFVCFFFSRAGLAYCFVERVQNECQQMLFGLMTHRVTGQKRWMHPTLYYT